MRLTSSTTSHGVVDEEVKVGPNDTYTLYPGAKVFAPARPLHLSEDIWGSDVLKFNPDRFLQNPERGHQGNLSMGPFGGGTSLCPGRHFAGNEVKQFVVGVLRRFELEVHPGVAVCCLLWTTLHFVCFDFSLPTHLPWSFGQYL